MRSSWKTSLSGIGMILAGVASIVAALGEGVSPNWNINLPIILAGIGLLFAKDNA